MALPFTETALRLIQYNFHLASTTRAETRFTSRGWPCRPNAGALSAGMASTLRRATELGHGYVCMQRPATEFCGLTFLLGEGLRVHNEAQIFFWFEILPDDNVGRLHRTLQLD
jgi:hypothetical protein